ncbi:MAG: DUF6804 family protein [Bacteroidia bacterium]
MNGLKISRLIACGLLLTAIASLPYGYYRFLRIAITIISGVNAYSVFESDNKILFICFLMVAVLFNPIFPIYFEKATWAPIDLVVGVFFGLTAFIKTSSKNC